MVGEELVTWETPWKLGARSSVREAREEGGLGGTCCLHNYVTYLLGWNRAVEGGEGEGVGEDDRQDVDGWQPG